ncbi:unnamed protein product [Heligmosomoides polygyrus]|uniref:Reverse transcriptase domain-containing protein n=1 Tax=Heligmosomoides polygyrus TaxID=6339 RepID=A0A183FGR8_HELPZ|nr:unnamed protein product [Heligmosomoides polygyrus]
MLDRTLSCVPERLITVIRDMYEGSKAAIRTPHGVTRKVDITVGVQQGLALSPFLFLLTLDSVVNHLEEGPLRTILYADDIALVAENQEELEEKVQLWQRALADNGLRLNVKKTKFICSEQCAGSILDCQGETIEKVEEFRYLGSDLSEEGSVDQAVRGHMDAAWLKWRESTGILCYRRCSRTLKGKLYRTVVRPALLYGSECWALGEAQERQLHAAEMRMLRWACGWTCRDRVRNEDVRAVMKTALIQLKMREQRLRWYGHVLRRPEDHPTRLALDFEAPGKRPRGAPRKRWKDVIKRDLAEVGATADDALDRMRWRQITRTEEPATARDKTLRRRRRRRSARPYIAGMTRQKLLDLGWEVLPHPSYCSDIAPRRITFSCLSPVSCKEKRPMTRTTWNAGWLAFSNQSQNSSMLTGSGVCLKGEQEC